jgi:WD40 repeat protein
MSAEQSTRYRAFISYSHVDKKWGDWLHKALETYRVPKALVGQPSRTGPVPKRLYPIFRDREELPTATSLSEQIEQALEHSDYLIVICSPRSAQSMWVNEEILRFKRLGRSDRILAIVVDGEPNASDKPGHEEHECFPPALRYELDDTRELSDIRTEPIAADARKEKDGTNSAKLKLIAGLIGVRYDSLAKRDQRRRSKNRAFLSALSAVILLTFCSIWFYGVQQREAEQRQRLIEESSRLSDLSDQAFAAGHYDRALLLALNALPGLYGGDRPWFDPARLRVERAAYYQQKVASFPHQDDVWDIDVSSDGKRLVAATGELSAASKRSFAKLWNLQSKELVARLEHDDAVVTAAFSPDADWVATGSYDGSVKIWRADSGHAVRVIEGTGVLDQASFSPLGNLLLTISLDAGGAVWNVSSGEQLLAFDVGGDKPSAAFGPEGKYIAIARGQTVDILDLSSGETSVSFAHEAFVNSLTFCQTDAMLATATADGFGYTWQLKGQTSITTVEHGDPVQHIRFSPDCALIATASDFGVSVWDSDTGAEVADLDEAQPQSLVFDDKGERILISAGSTASLWEVGTGENVAVVMAESDSTEIFHKAIFGLQEDSFLTASSDGEVAEWAWSGPIHVGTPLIAEAVNSVELRGDPATILSITESGRAVIQRLGPGRDAQSLEEPHEIIHGAIAPSGRFVVIGSASGEVATWDADSGTKIGADQLDAPVAFVDISSNRGRVAIGSEVGELRISDRSLEKIISTSQHGHPLEGGQLSQDGDKVLTISGSLIRVWKAESGELIREIDWSDRDDLSTFESGKLSPDGEMLLIIPVLGREISIVDIRRGNEIARLRHETDVLDADFSSDSMRVVTVSESEIAIWEAPEFVLAASWDHDTGYIDQITFTPDRKRLATRSRMMSRLWDVEVQEPIVALTLGERASDIAFSSDNELIAVASAQGVRIGSSPVIAPHILSRPHEFLPANRRCLTPEEREARGMKLLTQDQMAARGCKLQR